MALQLAKLASTSIFAMRAPPLLNEFVTTIERPLTLALWPLPSLSPRSTVGGTAGPGREKPETSSKTAT